MVSMLYNALKEFGLGNSALVVLILSLFIDLTPGIKFNPVKWVLKQFGDAFNHKVDKKIDDLRSEINQKIDGINDDLTEVKQNQVSMTTKIEQQSKDIDIAEVNRLKSDILSFSNRLQRKQKFTSEEYRTIMDSHERYETIINRHDDLENGRIDPEYKYILNHYLENKDSGEYMF